MSIIERIDELIVEAEKEPGWTAKYALRCLRKELLKEQGFKVGMEEHRYAIPTAWIYEYLDSLPETSADRDAITRMFVQWCKDEERKAETE